MTGELDLRLLLATLAPVRRPGAFVFVSRTEPLPPDVVPAASVAEAEGTTFVVTQAEADAHGWGYDFVAAWITLEVRSALAAVGLSAAVTTALAGAGISANVLAGLHHDHLLVPADRADDALRALTSLGARDR
ncbi:MAG: acetyltransferase [Acidimicrobiales bacterium]|nr:acetyltransferase [Acidimicrobiales bacterium]